MRWKSESFTRRFRRARARTRSALRRLVWWVWPSHPTSWSALPARLRPAATQIARLTIAAVVAYVVTDALSPGLLDLTAPLTALLVVQASTVGTLQMGVVRVGAVLTGVLVAVGVANWFGLSWWSLGAVIAASLLLARVLRLGEQSLETPISAMLILAVSSPELAAEDRVGYTLIGTAVGVAFSLLFPVPIPNERAIEAVHRLARTQAALLDEVALTLSAEVPHEEEVRAWIAWCEDIRRDIEVATADVAALGESRRLKPSSPGGSRGPSWPAIGRRSPQPLPGGRADADRGHRTRGADIPGEWTGVVRNRAAASVRGLARRSGGLGTDLRRSGPG